MEAFKIWLTNTKNFEAKSAMDVASRLKRCQAILGTDEMNEDSITKLENEEEFLVLSISVKSQLRRAVKLHLEFKQAKK